MTRKEAEQRARKLVGQMTLREKVTQLRYDSPAVERLGIPAYNWWNEALHGVARGGTATSFPQAIGLAATFDEALVEKLGDAAATEGRAKYNQLSAKGDRDIYHGLSFWSPNINIFRDPRWGRGHETYGEDPCLTSALGQAYVRGLQGDSETMKAAACAKHFAVHSGPEALRHQFNAVASRKDMEETYLPAFEDLVKKAKVEAVMGAYNRTNGEPCCGSKTLLVDTLRGKWGFEGHVVSDCWAIRDFHTGHHVTANSAESTALALKMGCDLNCGNSYQCLLSAYEQDLITEEQISEAAVRLFTTRFLLGIMGEGTEFDSIPYTAVECEEHLRLAHEAALESCVLLKNKGILPLKKEGTIGVIGPNANSRGALIGNYYGTSSRYITVLEGIQDAMEGHGRVLYSEGCHLFRDRVENLAQAGDRLAEAIAVTEASDLIIMALGYDERLEGEEPDDGNACGSGDKTDLLLPAPQRELLNAVLAVGKPVVLILMAGSSVDVSEAEEKADAVLLTWYPGARGGRAVAQLLFGEKSPSGKLPVTFYRNEALDEMPAFTDYTMAGRTYRYYGGMPLYPFGYGLSYAEIDLSGLRADREAATVTLNNHSAFDAEEVVQLYIRDEFSPDAAPNPVLCGFARVSLKAGEAREVRIPIRDRAFTVVSKEGERIPGSGQWALYAGFGQPDPRTEKLTGKKALRVSIRG
ncbi:MAG: glycoside hydrolase family 3 C-terminal domain-containing protein [Oscillospiraceae bacterium]|nr:glycoside hydrolase family 3 C-terminal domain-containing protein [Oscillospiraceae bacterium]